MGDGLRKKELKEVLFPSLTSKGRNAICRGNIDGGRVQGKPSLGARFIWGPQPAGRRRSERKKRV